jgi:hypothetical protein
MYLGDFAVGGTVVVRFNTEDPTGAAVTLAGTPAISVYKNSTTESTSGVTLTVDYDGRTGLHSVAIDTSADGTFYAAGNTFDVVITTGTVNGISAVGDAVGSFSLASRTIASMAAGTVTAAAIAADAVTEIQSGLATAAALATVDGVVDDILLDTAEIGAAGAGLTNINLPNQTMDIVGNITGNLSGSVGSVTGAVGSVTGNVGGNVTGTVGGFTAGAKAEIQTEAEDAIVTHRLDELLNADSDIDGAAPPTVGSVFHELLTKTAGSFTYDQTTDSLEAVRDRGDAAWTTATGFSTHSAADVWASATRRLTDATNITSTGGTTVPQTGDSYAIVNSGTHGNAALKALIDAVDDYVDTELAAIKAKTDNLPSDPADASDIAASFTSIASTLTTMAAYIDTEVAAIKAKTDNLPAAPAATGDIPTAVQNADALLGRNIAGGSNGSRDVTSALRAIRNKVNVSASAITVYQENDTDEAWTGTATRTAGLEPLQTVDPT